MTLGLVQAVHKRKWELEKNRTDLERAIWASEKAFQLTNDLYNGLKLAGLYEDRSAVAEDREDAIADHVLAKRMLRRVVELGESLCQEPTNEAAKWFDRDAKYWIPATLAEAYQRLGQYAEAAKYMREMDRLNPPDWALESTTRQLEG